MTNAYEANDASKSYRAYVLGALLLVYTFNFVDRILIGVLQEPIKRDLGISNFHLGLLGGPAFAILYTLLGVPIARIAERTNRISIIAIGLGLWSAMTVVCGFAANFWQLAAARVGVGIGEAACTPPSHSVISDYFRPDRRASALSIYGLGVPIGTALAAIGGGWLTQHLDWRAAFWLLGAPGLLLAIALKLTVREPKRATSEKSPTFAATISSLLRKRSLLHTAFGGALVAIFGYGSLQFLVSHFVRNFYFGATLAEEVANSSYAYAAIGGLAVGIGTFSGGFISDRLTHRHPRILSWLPALGLAIAAPIYFVAFLQTAFPFALGLLLIAALLHYLYFGPMFSITQAVAPPRMRATAAALLLLAVNLIGYAFGPPLVGAANDLIAASILANQGLALTDCDGDTYAAVCAAADASGLRYALAASVVALAWGAVHFWLGGKTLAKDRVD